MDFRKGLTFFLAAGGLWSASRAIRARLSRDALNGKGVLITGGSRGLGLVLARELADRGARLCLCARDPGELLRAQRELTQRGASVFTVPCDVSDRAAVEQMVYKVRREFQSIDVLINCAGSIGVGPVEVQEVRDFQKAMDTNFYGALHTILAVLPEMQERRQGRIVNICSIGGKLSVPHLLPYCASKFALVGLSEGLRAELQKDGIRVTTVCPGLMRTGSPRHAIFKGQNRKEFAWFSIGDALPLSSVSAERAARRIVSALILGEAEVVISPQALAAVRFHGLFPGLTSDLLGLVNRFLPRADGDGSIGKRRKRGADSTSVLAPSALTLLSDRAARKNNEIP